LQIQQKNNLQQYKNKSLKDSYFLLSKQNYSTGTHHIFFITDQLIIALISFFPPFAISPLSTQFGLGAILNG
jgi:hypothetical protein